MSRALTIDTARAPRNGHARQVRRVAFAVAILLPLVFAGLVIERNFRIRADFPPATCEAIHVTTPLNCQAAVVVAEDALPTSHGTIVSIAFHYGRIAGLMAGCVEFSDEGYVVFTTRDPAQDLWVTVRADANGSIKLTRSVGHYPPAVLCQPSA